jgi:hypothetical protein
VNAGILSEEEARSHPLKNVVTRALGGGAHVAVDLIELPVGEGDRYLLCSDGLTGMVSDEEILEALSSTRTPEQIVRGLVDLANERGGVDNITAIMVVVKPSTGKKAEDESSEKTTVSLRAPRNDEDDLTPTEGMPIPVVPEPPAEPGPPPAGPEPVPAATEPPPDAPEPSSEPAPADAGKPAEALESTDILPLPEGPGPKA